ncbi:MAG: CHAT domain-containing protein [Pseudonocardiales bacterium]|nr:CHAT domain-containing protein [Pseudonocardiales bacterium]
MLTEPGGVVLADYEVRLDESCWQYEAFTDLWGWLSLRIAPDRRGEQEAEVLTELGKWIGEQVFGPVGSALVREQPTTVRVVIPGKQDEARQLVYRPLELAHVGGRPLAVQDVTLVMQVGADKAAGPKAGVAERLRVLALFSLPTGDQPLNLRRERTGLVDLFDQVAVSNGRAVDVRVLQYGVTRERLSEILNEPEGWDIVHMSSHGEPGKLFLEKDDGSADPVEAVDLAGLLMVAQARLKLVTVSACSSAADAVAEQLGLPDVTSPTVSLVEQTATKSESAVARFAVPLATELVERLDCAVLAMRYPVGDDFAISLSKELYALLAREGSPLARAVGVALKEVITNSACSALSVASPALFGERAVELRLAAPARSSPDFPETQSRKLEGFDHPPEHFVGRVAVMAQASAALAPRSDVSGVLLYGMPGVGKRACALELAYTHEHAFEHLVWFVAPDKGSDIRDELTRFVLTLKSAVPGFQFVGTDGVHWLQRHLPALTELMERKRVLIVVDNVESLLDMSGRWQDPRWNDVITALVAHSGVSRLIMASRRVPEGLHPRVKVAKINALSRDEALHLARELPNLDRLLDGRVDGLDPDTAHELARRVLAVAQGHPELLRQANGQAADPNRLRALLGAAEQAGQEAGRLPEGFFTIGKPSAAAPDYLHVLGAWTRAAIAALTPTGRDVLHFLCCLEAEDRIRWVVEGTWTNLCVRLGQRVEPDDLRVGFAELVDLGLISIQPDTDQQWESYEIHPTAVAEGSTAAGLELHTVVDTELGRYWGWQSHRAQKSSDVEDDTWVVWAGLCAAPYLLRVSQPELAAELLEQALLRDRSTENVARVLPILKTIATFLKGTVREAAVIHLQARAWEVFDPITADQLMQQVLETALARWDYRSASMAAGGLSEYRKRSGQLKDALRFAEYRVVYVRRAGLGPWTQLGAETQRLAVLATMGRAAQVLSEVDRLRAGMDILPHDRGRHEMAHPFKVRENLLHVGATAALRSKHWEAARRFIRDLAEAQRARRAPETEIARTEFNEYGALLELGLLDEAEALLRKCRKILESGDDTEGLGKLLGAVADIDDDYGRGDAAIRVGREALRYSYRAGDVQGIQTAHHNLGRYLAWYEKDGAGLAHLLTAALICAITATEGMEESVDAIVFFHSLTEDPTLPGDVAALCRRVAETPGVDLQGLLARLTSHQGLIAQAFDQILAQAWQRGVR